MKKFVIVSLISGVILTSASTREEAVTLKCCIDEPTYIQRK